MEKNSTQLWFVGLPTSQKVALKPHPQAYNIRRNFRNETSPKAEAQALHQAVVKNAYQEVIARLEAETDVNAQNRAGMPPLHIAAVADATEMAFV